jgi:threonyl-tRNA synthetase
MAQAVQDLFPGVLVSIGPAIEDGFYYDFEYGNTFTPEELEKIEAADAGNCEGGSSFCSRGGSREEACSFLSG